MAHDLKPAPGAMPDGPVEQTAQQTAAHPEPAVPSKRDGGSLSSRGERALWLVIAVLAASAVFLGWRAYIYEEEGDPVASAMLAFEKQNSLIVFASRFEVVAQSEYEQTIATVPVRRVRQAMIVPATLDYRLDLSAMDASDFVWDEASATLTVTLPQLQTSTPNLDEANARLFTEGLLNTGGSQQMLSASNSRIAQQKASAFAKNPEILSLARAAAKDAVRQNLAIPLQVAGFDNARIKVEFE
ncbi:MAG: DUF4230 domain-containing protein [Pseudomonadota bacterium]